MSAIYIEGRYVPAGPWAARKIASQVQHLKGSFRTDERREERRLCGPDGEIADQAAARALLTAAIGPKVTFHRLILSPLATGRPAAARRDDLEEWTRLVLADLGRELGLRLVWVAAVHGNTDTPHVHVLVGGAAERVHWPGKGQTTSVELRRGHYRLLQACGDARAAEIAGRLTSWSAVG